MNDLGAHDRVAAVLALRRPRAYRAHVRSRLRLGQTHRAAPLAAIHLVQVQLLLFLRAERLDHLCRADCQARVHVEGRVGPGEHLLDHDLHRAGSPLTAVLLVHSQALPPGLIQLVPGLLETRRCDRSAPFDPAALLVTSAIQRPENLCRELVALAQHHPDVLLCPRFERRGSEQLRELELLEQNKRDFAQVGLVEILLVGHRWVLLAGRVVARRAISHVW